ncbi:NAD-dependent epimerase/dehydratase family protein, partial [Thermococcus sp.]
MYDEGKEIKEIAGEFRKEFEGKIVLVSGAAGFLGSWLSDVLLDAGAEVYGIDNFASGLRRNIERALKRENFHFYEADVSKKLPEDILKEKYDFVFHLASRASPFEFEHYPLEIIDSNTIGTRNMLEIAKKSNARFLFTSTSEIYGQPRVVPTPETYWGYVNPIGI